MGAIRLFVFLLAFVSFGYGQSPYQYVRIPADRLDQALFEEAGFIRDHKSHINYIFGYLPIEKLTLSNLNRYHVVFLDEAKLRHNDFDAVSLEVFESALDATPPPLAYHTYETLTKELKELADAYPDLMKLESAGKTVQGRELWIARLTNYKSTVESRPKLLYISSMHGDEVTGKEMMIYLIREFLVSYGRNSRLSTLIDNAELFIMPSMNPDGTEMKQRWNANGVDLNRNFPKLSEPEFSMTGREPETLALMELHRKHHFAVAMNFHGGDLCVNIPWDSKPNQKAQELFGDNALMLALANDYAKLNLPMYDHHEGNFEHGVTYGYEWFQILGGMQDWASFFRQSTHATLEMSVIKWPDAGQLPKFWKDNHDSLVTYLEDSMVGIHLKVVDGTGKAVPVTVAIDSAARKLTYPNGFVHRPTIEKTQVVTLTGAGYSPKTLTLSPRKFDGNLDRVVMDKLF